jgi:post-segregation antitoxin (ccd killing protein)
MSRKRNLTLSIDQELLKDARKAALDMDTSVNGLIRDYLRELVERYKTDKNVFLDEWLRLMNENGLNMKDFRWNRAELHER